MVSPELPKTLCCDLRENRTMSISDQEICHGSAGPFLLLQIAPGPILRYAVTVMSNDNSVCIGLVGGGYAGQLHCIGYRRVAGVSVTLRAIADVDLKKAQDIKERFGIQKAVADFQELLDDPEIDVVDICTPPFLHVEMITRALRANKHVICEKPLSGYFGEDADESPIGTHVPKKRMYERVLSSLDGLAHEIGQGSARFFYAENFLYAPALRRIAELVRRKRSRILFMHAIIAVKGSSRQLQANGEPSEVVHLRGMASTLSRRFSGSSASRRRPAARRYRL